MELSKAKSLRPRRSPRLEQEDQLPFGTLKANRQETLQGLEEPEALFRRSRRKSECEMGTTIIDR